jgi:hypothetical protein
VKRRAGAVAGGAAAAVLLAGCVNLPTSGTVNNADTAPDLLGATQQGVRLAPLPPGAQWLPQQIVNGFLAATGATWDGKPDSLGVAREFLTARYAKRWRPTPAATVIDTAPVVVPVVSSPHVTGGQAVAQVSVTSRHLSTLVSANAQEAGSILASSRPGPYVYDFDLIQVEGKWRISSVSGPGIQSTQPGQSEDDSILLLENSDFLRDYQPRNLYFPAVAPPHTLVPFPVYIPDQSGPLGVQPLVDGLTSLPPAGSNWLYRSVTTAFKPGSKLTTQVQAPNQAIVDLQGTAANVSPTRLRRMEAQLVWTLTSSPYSVGSGIQSVSLQIGTRSVQLLPSQFASWVPGRATDSLYFQMPGLAGYPDFSMISTAAVTDPSARSAPAYTTQVRPAKLGAGPLTAVAVSPPSSNDALRTPEFAGCRGKTVYVAQLGFGSDVTTQPITAPCTSLSWDGNGYLWVSTATGVFRIQVSADGLHPVPIAIAAPLAPSDTFAELRLAADGVRVAMIIKHGKRGASVYVTSISQKSDVIYLAQNQQLLAVGPELTDPIALSWWGSDHLLVLDKKAGRTSLYEVPLNGGQSTELQTPSDAVSVAANGTSIAVGTSGPRGPEVRVVREIGGTWHRIAGASSPTYPG